MDARGSELELSWHEQPRMFMVSLFSGQVAVRGPATAGPAWSCAPGESLLARADDGFLRVGRGRALLDALPREDANRVSAALSAVVEQAAAEPAGPSADDGFGGEVGPTALGRGALRGASAGAALGLAARFAGAADR